MIRIVHGSANRHLQLSLLLLIASCALPVAAQTEPESLFVGLSLKQDIPGFMPSFLDRRDPWVRRQRLVHFRQEVLGRPARSYSVGASPAGGELGFRLNLFHDVSYDALVEGRERKAGSGSLHWFGRLDGIEASYFVLIQQGEWLLGTIYLPGAVYQIRPLEGSLHLVTAIDPSVFGPDEPPDLFSMELHQEVEQVAEEATVDDGAFIDVLVLYTDDVRKSAGSLRRIRMEIEEAEELTNRSYDNSGIDQRIRVVGPVELDYAESGKAKVDVDRLQKTADGHLDEGHELRNAYAADLVLLFVTQMEDKYCGWAFEVMGKVKTSFRTKGFCVVRHACSTANLSFPHELGHLMSARHDRYVDAAENRPFKFNHGYVDVDGPWRTVMAYPDQCKAETPPVTCTRIPFWSNPDVEHNGRALGEDDTDNRRALNNTAVTVANFVTGSLAEVYIDERYRGQETGSRSKPFNTLSEGAFRAGPGATLWVNDGSYPETLVTRGERSLIIDRHLVLRLYGGGSVTIGR